MQQGDDAVGKTMGGYRLVRRLGRGGMGAVYEAVQESLGRKVALKLLHSHLANDADVVTRFRREAEAAARLGHPNIVQVTDFGHADDGSIFLVMELLPGRSLADVVRKDGALAPERAAWVAWQVLEALSAAHAVGIVHRDLKPDNVMLVEVAGVADVAKLLDFGIAKLADQKGDVALTQTGMVLGTPAYMAPEQARAKPVDHRTDLYAVGALLYESLCGAMPYTSDSYNGLIAAILTERPRPLIELRPALPRALVAVVEKAMAREPAERFQSAHEMADALAPLTGRTLTTTRRAPKNVVETAETMAVPTPVAPAARMEAWESVGASAPVIPPTQLTPAPAPVASPGTTERTAPPKRGGGMVPAAIVVAALLVVGAILWSKLSGPVPGTMPSAPPGTITVPLASVTPVAARDAAAALPPLPAVPEAGNAAAPPDAGAARRDAGPRRPPPPPHLAVHGCDPHGLTRCDVVRAAFAPVAATVARCYTNAHVVDGEFTITVTADGHVTGVRPYGDTHGPAADRACVQSALGNMVLPDAPTGPGDIAFWFEPPPP